MALQFYLTQLPFSSYVQRCPVLCPQQSWGLRGWALSSCKHQPFQPHVLFPSSTFVILLQASHYQIFNLLLSALTYKHSQVISVLFKKMPLESASFSSNYLISHLSFTSEPVQRLQLLPKPLGGHRI